MSVEREPAAVPTPDLTCAYLARVRLPDGSEQDVLSGRGPGDGELLCELIDGQASEAPALTLDFSQGSTPRVSWLGAEPPLELSLEIVAKVCAALARAARGDEAAAPQPVVIAELPPVEPEPLPELPRTSRAPLAWLAAGFAAAGLVAFALWPKPQPAPKLATAPVVIAAPAPAPSAPVVVAAPKPIVQVAAPPPPVIAEPASPAPKPRAHGRGMHLAGTTVQHGVKGLAAGTGVVALRTVRGLEVAVDGLWVGMTPVKPMVLSAGPHVLELRKTEKVSRTLDLDVGEGDRTTLTFEFD